MDLNRASTFVRVVETGGFTRAASSLNLPPSSVSRAVARLEDELGVVLLERTTRKVALTDAGKAFFERAREALAGLAEANALALDAANAAHGVVRVAFPPDFAGTTGSLLAPFLAAHPRIRVELAFTMRGAELVGDLVDLAVAIGRLPDSTLITRRIGTAQHGLYAAPSYLAARGTPRALADLAKHDAILLRAVGGDGVWELEGPRGAERVEVHARVVGDHVMLAHDAAVAGLGIAMLPEFLAHAAVDAGTLARVLPKLGAAMQLHVLAHGGRHLPRRVALLRDFLVGGLGQKCTKHGARPVSA